jgi:hypothetical protein
MKNIFLHGEIIALGEIFFPEKVFYPEGTIFILRGRIFGKEKISKKEKKVPLTGFETVTIKKSG